MVQLADLTHSQTRGRRKKRDVGEMRQVYHKKFSTGGLRVQGQFRVHDETLPPLKINLKIKNKLKPVGGGARL